MRKIILSIYILLSTFNLLAQVPASWTSADMYLAIRKLNVLGSVLYVAAHPDDDNSRLIAYLSKEMLYRTGYLSMTRGDGGQNLIGDEQGIELGLIRTQELLASRKVDGGEQFFTRAFDFGYSKNPEETFTKWDKEKILSDVVWVIRKFQPDVVITRFPTTGEGGHGHHTASAILANEAYAAAADPNRFPEQLKYVKPWQVKRVMWNTFNFGGTNTTRDDQLHFDVGGYNPLLGKSYGEIGAESRSQNKSQGTGSTVTRGEAFEYFRTTSGSTPANDLMDGVDITWNKIAGANKIPAMVEGIASSFNLLHPERSVKGLVQLYNDINALPDSYWRNKKLDEVKQLIEQCSGLFIDATTNQHFAVQGDSIRINFTFNNRLGADVSLIKVSLTGDQLFDTSFNQTLLKDRNFNFSKTFFVSNAAMTSQPYWLNNPMEEGYYSVTDQQKIGQPDVDPTYWLLANLKIEGQEISFASPVKYKFTDPVKGELYEPLAVIPAVLISADEELKLSKDNNNFDGTLTLIAKRKNVPVAFGKTIGVKYEGGDIKFEFNPTTLQLEEKDKKYSVAYKINATKDNEYKFWTVRLQDTGKITQQPFPTPQYHLGMNEIKYDHIPFITYFSEAKVKNVKLDLKTYGKKIGYIVGAGDKVPEALEQMGYEVNILSLKELARNDLGKFDAIITGVRAYNTNEFMNNYYDKLMKYVNDGGNLIVQYNRNNQGLAKMGPYPLSISGARITDENAEVIFLKPDHPVMNFPNKITQDDFKGWIQERSIYHAANFDKKNFETIFSMHDPGENPDEGSLLIAKYGKGVFVYTGLVFFRELPAGVPGAYRLLANIIALNRKKGF